ncbi:MAG: Crp/Fnr family transcriptional regulator [Pseudomonadota bacterium]
MTAVDKSLLYELRQHDFFKVLDDEALGELVGLTQTKIFSARKAIFNQGEDGDSLFVILSGRVKIVTISPAGKETVLCFMGPGEVLGEIAVLDSGPRTAGAIVIEKTRALVLRRSVFMGFLEEHPKAALNIIRVLCGRLRKTDKFVEEMTTLQAGPRLARALLRLASQYGKVQPSGGVLVDIKLSQANLGAHAGVVRENVNRHLKMWEDDGVLEGKDGLIMLHRPEALEQIADSLN